MNLLTRNAAAPQPAAGSSTKGAAAQVAPESPDVAVLLLADVLQSLHSGDTGLSASGAAAILEKVGPNQIDSTKPKSLLAAFIERFSNPLVLVLLFAAAVSALTGGVPSFANIAVIVLMSVILDVRSARSR